MLRPFAMLQPGRAAGKQTDNKTTANLIIRPGDAGQIVVGPEFASLEPYQRCTAGR